MMPQARGPRRLRLGIPGRDALSLSQFVYP
jgi:hypothetical protein